MVCALALVHADSNAQPAAFDLKPPRPVLWDNRELDQITLPPAVRDGKIVYLPSDVYYKLKPLPIYKTYPVYDLNREPKGYFDYLRQQEPEVVFDPQNLQSEPEWRRAGELVFNAPTDFAPAETIHDAAWFRAVRPPMTRDGIVPAISYVIRKKGVIEVGTGACANCHSRVLADGSYLPGAQGNYPFDRAYAEALHRDQAAAVPARLATSLLMPQEDKARWTEHLYERPAREIIAVSAAMIPGVAMRPGFSYLDPPKIADLIGVRDRRYLDLTVRLEHRSLPDIARYGSMCWASNYFFSSSGNIPAAEIAAVSDSRRYSDEEAYAFAVYVYSLQPPSNPNRPTALTRKGEAVFQREGCPGCHTPPLYTNNKILPAGDFHPTAVHRARYDILDANIGLDSAAALKSLRGRGYYKVPSLKGVWYRGPFIHNGTIGTLEDWFDPRRLSADYVPSGYRAYGVTQRPVPGHPFGLLLKEDERRALIAFLRTL
jgi:hypothetical protein